jgi:hypothetical protein
MTGNIFMQLFILFDVFVIGLVTTEIIHHAYAHYHPQKSESKKTMTHPTSNNVPAAIREHMLEASKDQFQTVIDHSADLLQHDLKTTAEEINKLVIKLATEIVSGELESYRLEFSKLQDQAKTAMGSVKEELAGHEDEIKAKITAEFEAEKQRLLTQIDTKLGDAVISFLTETLQHNVDLGSQSTYLMELLEEHKADFSKEVTDEA